MEKHEHGMQDEELKNDAKTSRQDVDLGQMLSVQATAEEEQKVPRKIDLALIPMMGFAYFWQFLDKMILSQTTLFGLREDLNLHGSQYSWSSAIFYFGYLFWSWPNSYIIVRLPIGKYISCSIFLWGGILMCHAACKDFTGLMTARFFLGVGEAAIAPGFTLITGMFYKREEQPVRQAGWFFGNCLASLLGGLIAWGIGNIDSAGIKQWKLMFLIPGAITSSYGLFLFFLLPDSPAKAVFLKPKERAIAVQRTLKNKTGVMDNGSFKWKQAREALIDPQTWCLFLNSFCNNLWNGGITSFMAILTAGFGFSDLKSLLMQMNLGASQIVFLIITSVAVTLIPSFRIHGMIINTLISAVGLILVWKLDGDLRVGRMFGLCLSIVYAVNLPLSLSVVTSNVAGFTKKSVVTNLIFVSYCAGNIVGPQLFVSSEEPRYPTGLKASLSTMVLSAFFLVCLYMYYAWANRRRNKRYRLPEEMTVGEEMQEELSNKTDWEIESFRYIL